MADGNTAFLEEIEEVAAMTRDVAALVAGMPRPFTEHEDAIWRLGVMNGFSGTIVTLQRHGYLPPPGTPGGFQ